MRIELLDLFYNRFNYFLGHAKWRALHSNIELRKVFAVGLVYLRLDQYDKLKLKTIRQPLYVIKLTGIIN